MYQNIVKPQKNVKISLTPFIKIMTKLIAFLLHLTLKDLKLLLISCKSGDF
jgi:hypothetical protein